MFQSCRAHLFSGARLIQQNSRFEFFCLLNFFSSFFMNLLVKIYKKRYDRHNGTLWKTDFLNSVFCLVSCSSKIKFHISKLWPTQIWHVCCSEKKQTNKRVKKNGFRSGLPICHELWDIAFIFSALSSLWWIETHHPNQWASPFESHTPSVELDLARAV